MSFSFSGLSDLFASGARLLPGYVAGERQARQDNWQDRFNYNQDMSQQLTNLYDQAVFEPHVSREQDLAFNSRLGVDRNYNDHLMYLAGLPSQYAMINAANAFMPYLAPMNYANQFMQGWMMPSVFQQYVQQGGMKPSILG